MAMTSTRKVFHVTHHAGRGWLVKAEDALRAADRLENKSEAVARARELAKRHRRAQVIVHKMDGTIQTEYTYGDDPHPPEG